MSLDFTSADTGTYMSYSAGDFAGNGAHTMAILVRNDGASAANFRLMTWMASSTEQNGFLVDSGGLYGDSDFSSGFGSISTVAWRVLALTKASGSQTYRMHIWDYASDGSGTMSHGVASGAGNHANFSTATTCRVGWAQGVSHDSQIAVVAYWDSALSDGQLDTLKSGSLSAWNALAPDLGVHYGSWNGTTGDTVFSGSSGTGTKTGSNISGTGVDPSGFDYTLGGGGSFNGTASRTATATISGAGVVGKVATAAVAATVAITAAGVVGTSTTASRAETATITAAGSVGTSAGASIAATGTITAGGTVTASGTGSASLAATDTITAAGSVGTSSGATISATASITASGVVGKQATASIAATGTLTAAGTVVAGGAGSAAVAETATITAAGIVGATSAATVSTVVTITASGQVGTYKGSALAGVATITANGVVVDPNATVYDVYATADAAQYEATTDAPQYRVAVDAPEYTAEA